MAAYFIFAKKSLPCRRDKIKKKFGGKTFDFDGGGKGAQSYPHRPTFLIKNSNSIFFLPRHPPILVPSHVSDQVDVVVVSKSAAGFVELRGKNKGILFAARPA